MKRPFPATNTWRSLGAVCSGRNAKSKFSTCLRREFTAALNDPDTMAKLQKAGLEGRSSTAEELQTWLKAETSRVQTLVERVGLQKN